MSEGDRIVEEVVATETLQYEDSTSIYTTKTFQKEATEIWNKLNMFVGSSDILIVPKHISKEAKGGYEL